MTGDVPTREESIELLKHLRAMDLVDLLMTMLEDHVDRIDAAFLDATFEAVCRLAEAQRTLDARPIHRIPPYAGLNPER